MLQQLVRGSSEDPYNIEWQEAPFNGQGSFTWPDESRYEGEWLDGMPHGHGKYVWSDGCSYEGGWNKGLPDGPGEYIFSDGTKLKSEWGKGRSKAANKAHKLTADLKATIESQNKTIAELQKQLDLQTAAVQKTESAAIKDAETRCKALETEKIQAENKIKALEQQAEILAIELESTIESHQRAIAELQQQLTLQVANANHAGIEAVKEAEIRYKALEVEKIGIENKVKTLEEQTTTLTADLNKTIEDQRVTIAELQQQLNVQINAAQKAETLAIDAGEQLKALEAEKRTADEKIKTLELQIESFKDELDNTGKNQKKTIAELQQQLEEQIDAAQKAEASAAEAEERLKALESEKTAANEIIKALELQIESFKDELDNTGKNQKKTIAELQQQLEEQIDAAQKAETFAAEAGERLKAFESEKTAADEKIKALEIQIESFKDKLDTTGKNQKKTIAELQGQLEEQIDAAQKAETFAAETEERLKALESEKTAADEIIKTLELQIEELRDKLNKAVKNQPKAIIELSKQLEEQIDATQEAEAAAADAEKRCNILKAETNNYAEKVKILEQQIATLTANSNKTAKNQPKSVIELTKQLKEQIDAAQKANTAALEAEKRNKILEFEKVSTDKKIKALEQQVKTLTADLSKATESQISAEATADIRKQLEEQIEALQKAEASTADAEKRYKELEFEKISADKKIKILEQQADSRTKLNNIIKDQKKTITDLKKQLALQTAAAQKAQSSSAEEEDRIKILEAEKISAEEKIKILEQQAESFSADLKNTIESQKKIIADLARQVAEADEKNTLLQESASNETEQILPRKQWSKVYSDGRNYLGELKDDLPDGLGMMVNPDGEQYVGEWSAGERNGRGTLILPNGSSYAGQWEKDAMSGEGILISPERKYMGGWKNNLYDGHGIEIFPDGKKYEGTFRKGQYDGEGTLTLPNGTRYSGAFKQGLSNGKGILRYPNGDRYEGEFKNNQYHGQGTLTLVDGRKYTGEMEKGLPHGQGIMILPDGRKFIGEFRNGKFVK